MARLAQMLALVGIGIFILGIFMNSGFVVFAGSILVVVGMWRG